MQVCYIMYTAGSGADILPAAVRFLPLRYARIFKT
jgi:hypothetical protein